MGRTDLMYPVAFALFVCYYTTQAYAQSCKNPCHPWVADDKCTRKTGKIDIRWAVTLPTTITRDNQNVSYLSYGFCANVDELQSFQLNYSAVSVALNKTVNSSGGAQYSYVPTESYLWMWGTGGASEPQFPGMLNDSSAMVYDGQAPECDGNPAVATMLIYNVTLNGGRFTYEKGAAVGVGFSPTCNDDNVCKMDPSLKCIGRLGMMNCAQCLNPNDPYEIVGKDFVIFNTYYGTDSRGKTLLSGSSNPLNFRDFAMGGAYNQISTDLTNIDNGARNANPLKDVDSYTWDGLGKAKLSTDVPGGIPGDH